MQQGSHISDFDIGKGDMMTKQKAKSAAKKDTDAKTKTVKKNSGTSKTAKAATAKKVLKKRVSSADTEPKKTKTPAVKIAATAAKTKTSAKASTQIASPAATEKKTAAKPSPEERYRMIETAAYFIAEKHGFQGRADEHWAAAERAIALKLGQ